MEREGPASMWTVTFLNSLYQVQDTLLSIIIPVLKIALILKIFFNKKVSKQLHIILPHFALELMLLTHIRHLIVWLINLKYFARTLLL